MDYQYVVVSGHGVESHRETTKRYGTRSNCIHKHDNCHSAYGIQLIEPLNFRKSNLVAISVLDGDVEFVALVGISLEVKSLARNALEASLTYFLVTLGYPFKASRFLV